MRCVLFILAALLLSGNLYPADADGKITRQEYINSWKTTAVGNMKQYRIPASIILAQGILESNCGNSKLATEANNHFGIKCHDWTGEKFYHDDDAKNECFRKYGSAAESYADHAIFLKTRQRYAFLFELDPRDYKEWAYGLKKAGYATNPQYPQLLIKIIEENQLFNYDDENFEDVMEAPLVAVMPPAAKIESKVKKGQKKSPPAEVTIFLEREISVSDNKIKFIRAKAGDSPQKIADDLQMGLWQVLRYNDLDKTDRLVEGQVIYLQPKRKKGKIERHTMKKGETLWEISQIYGVKLSRIYKLNDLEENSRVKEGQVLRLR